MTYAAFDASAEDADLVWLYTFTQGAVVMRYTNQPVAYAWGGDSYAPMAISHSEIELNGDLSKDKITITLPRAEAFALQFVSDVMDQETEVLIHRGFASDPDQEFVEWWDGSVGGGGSPKDARVELPCVSVRSLMRQAGLRRRYQKPCPHTHYGRGCWLDRADFAQAATLTAMSGVVLTVPAAAGFADGTFVGGQVADPDGILRWIIGHVGASITLLRPFGPALFADLAGAGTLAVTLYPGCDRTQETCHTVFDNLPNCGCLAYLPGRNPYNGSSIL